MQTKIGTDIAEIKRFQNIDDKTLNKIFHKTELKNKKPEVLAGIFAAKESCKKVFNSLDWLDIEILKKRTGRPDLLLNIQEKIVSYDLSISHDGEYAIASVIFLIEDKNAKK